MSSFITIRLRGALGKRFGREFKCVAASTTQAIRFLEVNLKDFRDWVLTAHKRGIVFKVLNNKYELDESELTDPLGEGWTIEIIPLFAATGRTVKIILGIGLIAAGAFGMGFLGLSPLQMIITGALLVISGLMGGKVPKPNDEEDQRSLVFSGQTNTSSSGNRMSVVYGRILTGSLVLSAAVRSYQTA